MPEAMSDEQVAEALKDLEGWSNVNGKLHGEFQFDNFVEAFGFMAQVALLAERAEHHPEWSNVYNQVRIDLVTHEAGDSITSLDVELARAINQVIA